MNKIKAIHKITGEVISAYDPYWSGKEQYLLESTKKDLLLCSDCKNPVTVIIYEDQAIPFYFFCNSELEHIDFLDPDSPIHDDFAEKEEEYYNPEHFENEED